jgi:hypothetical protein
MPRMAMLSMADKAGGCVGPVGIKVDEYFVELQVRKIGWRAGQDIQGLLYVLVKNPLKNPYF